MTAIKVYRKCDYCGQVLGRKYHNTVFPYCGNCNHDLTGEKVYTCGSCGISEPSNRMETEMMCSTCWSTLIEGRANFNKVSV